MKTPQQLLEETVTHLFKQGKRSVGFVKTYNIICAYRGKAGCKCAIGIHIPDEDYKETFEEHSVYTLPPDLVYKLFPHIDLHFLRYLQQLHDEANNWISTETMRAAVIKFADDFVLDATFVNNLSFSDR